MRDRTRHSLAVLLFLVFGPTCTAALLGWISLRRTSLAVWYETGTIREETGMNLTIDSVKYLRWNHWKYGEAEIPHPKTGQPFIVFSELENRLLQSEVPRSGSLFSFVLPQGVRGESFRRLNSPSVSFTLNSQADVIILSHLLLNQFGDRFAGRQPDLGFRFDEIEIRGPEFHFKLTFVEGRFRSKAGKCSLECTFNLQENLFQELISFTITRQFSEEPELIVELKTGETHVPARYLALLFPGLKSLGAEAFFHGTVRGELSKNHTWVVTFEDMTIENADLKTLGAGLTPYRLSGQVQMGVLSARMAFSGNQSRFLDAKGWIQITNGSMERKLLTQLVNDWQLSPDPNDVVNPLQRTNLNFLERPSQERQDASVAEATFFVLLGKDGIKIRPGFAKDEESGFVMQMDPDGFFKYYLPKQVSDRPISYSDLFHTFSPVDVDHIPLTPQIQRIVPSLFLTL